MNLSLINAIIIEDDSVSCQILSKIISEQFPNIQLIDSAGSCEKAISIINHKKPDLVFLDVEIEGGNAFSILDSVKYHEFEVIFVTSYEKYAIKAFKCSAVDYLLKPVQIEELQKALAKLQKPQKAENYKIRQDALAQNFKNPQQNPKKIIIPTSDKYLIVSPDEILRCQSDNYYTRIFFTDGTSTIVSKTLKEYELLLEDIGFIRVHNSHLVNSKNIRSYVITDGGFLIMSDNTEIPFSRRKKSSVLTLINQMFTS